MAISGGAKQAVVMQIEDGTLVARKYEARQDTVSDVGEIVRRLQAGESVPVHNYMPTVKEVERAVQAAMMEG